MGYGAHACTHNETHFSCKSGKKHPRIEFNSDVKYPAHEKGCVLILTTRDTVHWLYPILYIVLMLHSSMTCGMPGIQESCEIYQTHEKKCSHTYNQKNTPVPILTCSLPIKYRIFKNRIKERLKYHSYFSKT